MNERALWEPLFYEHDLFGDPLETPARNKLSEEFLLSPFSILNAREGWWQSRKAWWISLGIESEVGRGDNERTSPGGSSRPAADYSKNERGNGAGRPLAKAFNIGLNANAENKWATEDDKGSGTSIFDPTLCELAYRWFCPPGGQVIDPFAGGSVRGIVAAELGMHYWGCDLRPEQIEANYEQAKAITPAAIAPASEQYDFSDSAESSCDSKTATTTELPIFKPKKPVPWIENTTDGTGRRALLVIPPYLTTDKLVADLYPQPYAATCLAAVLRAQGWSVEIKDFLVPVQVHKTAAPESFAGLGAPPYRHYGQPFDDCQRWFDENASRFDVVGLCAGQCNLWEGGLRVADIIRAAGLPLVVGGSFVTASPDRALAIFGEAKYVIGEGENVVSTAMIQAIDGDLEPIYADRPDITKMPMPAWDLVETDLYPKVNGRPRGVLAVSRGCPWDCVFCSVWTVAGKKHRRLPPDQIRSQIMQLFDRGVRRICFLDDNLVISKKSADELLTIIETLRSEIPEFRRVRWYIEEGMEVRMSATPGLVARMAAAGFDNINIGLETANNARAVEAKKPYTADDMVKGLEQFKAAGITPKAFYIIGLPGDTLESVAEDLLAFGKLGLDVRANNLKLYPGTPVEQDFRARGLIDEDYDWRMSSFHTPDQKGLSFVQVRKLKVYLRAIGTMADEFGFRVFDDPLEQLAETQEIKWTDDRIEWRKKFFRATSYRRAMELVMLARGAAGAVSSITDAGGVLVERTDTPQDDIQAAIIRALGGNNDQLTWKCGDAKDLVPNAPRADFIFSCPPYGDLERYSDDPRDLSTMAYEKFIESYRAIVARCYDRLRDNRFACFIVGEYRDKKGNYRNFVGDTISAFVDAGFHYYNEAILVTAVGSLPIRVAAQFKNSRKLGKTHQNVLVFVKGDGKLATTNIKNNESETDD